VSADDVSAAIQTLASLSLDPAQRSAIRPAALALATEASSSPRACALALQVAGSGPDGLPPALVDRLIGMLDSGDALRQLVIDVRDRIGSVSAVIALGAEVDGKSAVIVATTPDARAAGLSAGTLAKRAAGVLGGGGGGRDDIAQGGGLDPALIATALDELRSELGR
jgi:hypothetical protein